MKKIVLKKTGQEVPAIIVGCMRQAGFTRDPFTPQQMNRFIHTGGGDGSAAAAGQKQRPFVLKIETGLFRKGRGLWLIRLFVDVPRTAAEPVLQRFCAVPIGFRSG